MARTDPRPMQNESKGPRSGIQVIARAASVLRALESEPDGLSLGEIAERVGLARSTVQRIVAALADEQFLIAATPKSRVKLGPALIRLANATRLEVSQLVRPFMEELSRQLGETIDLSVIQGKTAVFVNQVTGNHRLRTISAIGERFPLHSTACGKSLLATLSEAKLDKLLAQPLERFTPNTITDVAKLKRELAKIRKTSLAYDIEENTEGICAVSTAFEGPFGRAFALSIPTPATRFAPSQRRLQAALLETRDRITDLLGDETAA